MGDFVAAFDENKAARQKHGAEAVERGVDGGQIVDGHAWRAKGESGWEISQASMTASMNDGFGLVHPTGRAYVGSVKKLTVGEAQGQLAELIAEAHQGAVIVLTDGDKQVWLDPLTRIFHSKLESDAQNPMNRWPQRGPNAFLKGHGTQVWKPAIRQAWKPALHGFARFWSIDYEICGLKSFDLDIDNPELEAELLKAMDGPFTPYSPQEMRAIGERIIKEQNGR